MQQIQPNDHTAWLDAFEPSTRPMMAQCYIDVMQEDATGLTQALEREDVAAVRALLHKIKGGAAMVGHHLLATEAHHLLQASSLPVQGEPVLIQFSRNLSQSIEHVVNWQSMQTSEDAGP
ncbi:Hpt domain-containing protein [Vibrio cholerae]